MKWTKILLRTIESKTAKRNGKRVKESLKEVQMKDRRRYRANGGAAAGIAWAHAGLSPQVFLMDDRSPTWMPACAWICARSSNACTMFRGHHDLCHHDRWSTDDVFQHCRDEGVSSTVGYPERVTLPTNLFVAISSAIPR